MASISEDKIREMEEEMSRFEKEISESSSPAVGSQPVMGGKPFNKSASQLQMQHKNMTPPQFIRHPSAPALQPPPRPNFAALGTGPLRLSGPAPSHLQFVPHQLKNPGGPPMRMPLSEQSSRAHQSGAPVSYNVSQPSNNNSNLNKMAAIGASNTTSAPATISSTPVIISAKPTVYSAKPTKKISKPSNNSISTAEKKELDLAFKKAMASVPTVASIVPTFAKPTPSVSVAKVGPTLYPQIPLPDEKKKEKKNKKIVRTAGGQVWEDSTLLEWESDDFRVFCGDLGNDVTDEVLTRTFSRYSSFVKARVIRDKRTNKTKGYGFISFKDPQDFIKAMKDMNGKYVGSRPIKLRKSSWRDRNIEIAKKKAKEKQRLGLK